MGVTASRAVVLDRNIGRLRERIVFLQRKMAERGKPVDFLEEVEVATERALKEIIALSDFARDADPRSLCRDYPAMKAKADFALGDLLLVWGISLPDEKQDMTEEEKVIRLLFYHAKSTVKF